MAVVEWWQGFPVVPEDGKNPFFMAPPEPLFSMGEEESKNPFLDLLGQPVVLGDAHAPSHIQPPWSTWAPTPSMSSCLRCVFQLRAHPKSPKKLPPPPKREKSNTQLPGPPPGRKVRRCVPAQIKFLRVHVIAAIDSVSLTSQSLPGPPPRTSSDGNVLVRAVSRAHPQTPQTPRMSLGDDSVRCMHHAMEQCDRLCL